MPRYSSLALLLFLDVNVALVYSKYRVFKYFPPILFAVRWKNVADELYEERLSYRKMSKEALKSSWHTSEFFLKCVTLFD